MDPSSLEVTLQNGILQIQATKKSKTVQQLKVQIPVKDGKAEEESETDDNISPQDEAAVDSSLQDPIGLTITEE